MKLRTRSKFFAALGTAAVLTGTLSAPQPARAGLFGISEADEIRAGQQMRASVEQQYGRALSKSDPRQRRVERIGMRFARLSTRKNIPYSYTVLQNDKVLNAFAGPGGPIFVTTKLLQTTSNDAELAYVLGHETGHVDHKHIAKSVEKQQKVGLGVGILGAILGGGRGGNGNIVGTLAGVGYTLWEKGYSRDDENDADAFGVRMMAKLGYDPRAAVSMLGKLGDGPEGLSKVLSDHPTSKARRQRVTNLIAKDNLLDVAKRAGGPRLSMNGDDSDARYQNVSSDASTRDDLGYTAPGSANADRSATTSDDSPYDNAPTSTNAPYDNAPSREYSRGGRVDFGAPILVKNVGTSEAIALAPLSGFARWANAQVQRDGSEITLKRADWNLILRRNSSVAFSHRDGERDNNLLMPVAVTEQNGELYAPLSWLMQGLGGQVSIDRDNRIFNLSFSDGTSGSVPIP